MWVCFNNSFISVVSENRKDGKLTVRARRKKDLLALFPKKEPISISGRDYQFRVYVDREDMAKLVHDSVMDIDYDNFKGSTKDNHLAHLYHGFWDLHSRFQTQPPYSTYLGGMR